MGNTSYTAHISNKKSAITSKSKLLGVAKHNLRKYKSDDYSKDNIIVLRGTDDLLQDVKNVYHQEFDEVIKEYNKKQKRADRKIDDYFEHVVKMGIETIEKNENLTEFLGRVITTKKLYDDIVGIQNVKIRLYKPDPSLYLLW